MAENRAIIEIENVLDSFYRNNYKLENTFNSKYYFSTFKAKELKEVVEYYQPLLDEISNEDQEGINLTNQQKKSYSKLLHDIIDTCKDKIPERTRKKKIKTPEEIVKNLFYLPNLENIKSIDPKNIIGAKILVTYNDTYKIVTVFYSDIGFDIKGSTLENFNDKSFQKRLKGKVDINNFFNSAIMVIINTVKNMPTKSSLPTGRINKDTLLIRVSI